VRIREHNLYFAGLSRRDSVQLILSSIQVLLCGNTGPRRAAARVEHLWKERFSGDDAVVFPSARCGIRALLMALELDRSTEVLVTGYTCGAVPDAVTSAGAIPVYADVDAKTFAMDPVKAEDAMTPRTGALLLQHTYGIPGPVAELQDLARRKRVYFLEDACLALGSSCWGRPLGTAGDASVFSFELSKAVTAGWGGVVVTRLPGLGARLRRIRTAWGNLPRIEASRRLGQAGLSGMLYRPGTFGLSKFVVAALFRARFFRGSSLGTMECRAGSDHAWNVVLRQMSGLEETMNHGRAIAERYSDVLRRHGWQGNVLGDPSVRLVRFPVLVHDQRLWLEHFRRRGFELGRWFDAPVSPPPVAGRPPTATTCPVGSWLGEHMVNFPLHRRINQSDADRFCRILDHFLDSLPEAERFAEREPQAR
jgi:dTDP-4-amino-4,6-dideoxygalactose transaminase